MFGPVIEIFAKPDPHFASSCHLKKIIVKVFSVDRGKDLLCVEFALKTLKMGTD